MTEAIEDESVKERCWDQREALPGEPRCAICGRYGEYICDETDDDICSKECKNILLERLAKSGEARTTQLSPIKIYGKDECFYVKGNNAHVETLRRKIDIQVKGDSVPPPVTSFSSCDLPQNLQKNLEVAGYDIPTPVQMQVIPAALLKRHLLVSADTGSGKTASFLIPIIAHCSNVRAELTVNRSQPLAVVLTPTRELCIQVEEQAKVLGKGLPFKTALVVGGDAMPRQAYRIQNGVELIIGTPGRVIDLLVRHNFDLVNVSIFVVDEVDCMLQKGFREQVMQIFRALSMPQLLLLSATISPDVEKMASSMVKDLISIYVGKPRSPNAAVKQMVIWVDTKYKKQKLFEILTSKKHFNPPVVVFVESRVGADLLSEAITVATGLKAVSIHGEKPMDVRRESLRLFLNGDVMVIVATGVLGRGIDLLNVKQVIIFDMPKSIEEYIHQVGRASRMGEEGTAISFVNQDDKRLFKDLIQSLKSSGAAIPRELSTSCYSFSSQPAAHNSSKKRKLWSK